MWLSDAVPSNGTFGTLARSLSGPGSQASRSQFARPDMGTACRAESSLELKQLTQPSSRLSRRLAEIRSRQAEGARWLSSGSSLTQQTADN
jgi:hypothetical protein